MADIAVRSTQNIHGGGVGYKPTNTKPTARYTVTKTITKTSDTLATVTMVITIKTNYEFVAVGLGETLTYQLVIDGVQRGSVVLKTATQTMNASGTYTRTLVARNVPLDHRTTQSANLRLVNDKRSDWTFNSNTQGGDQIVGLPIGIQRSNFSSFSAFTVPDGAVTFNASVTRVSAGTTHNVTLRHGTTDIASWTGQGNFTSLSLTQAQSRTLLNSMKNLAVASVTLEVRTIHGGSALYTQTRNASATVGVSPSIGSVSVSDSSGALSAVGALVQGISNVTLSINNASAGYGASIVNHTFQWLGQYYRGKPTSTLDMGVVTRSGSELFTGVIINSRGQVAELSHTYHILPWSAPRSTSVKVQRCTSTGTLDPAGSYVRVTGSHSVSPLTVGGVNKNTFRVLVRYRAAGTTAWTNALNKTYPAGTVSTSESHTLGGTLDPTKSYDFEVIAYDRYANTVVTGLIPTERVLISKVRNSGVGFGKIRERGIIDAKGDVYVDGSIDVTNNVNVDGLLNFRHYRAPTFQLSTVESIDDLYDNYSNGLSANTAYQLMVSQNANHPDLGGGVVHMTGMKTSNDYEYQVGYKYSNNAYGVLAYARSKMAGTWTDWKKMSDTGTSPRRLDTIEDQIGGLGVRTTRESVWISVSPNSSHLLLVQRRGGVAEAGLYSIWVGSDGSVTVADLVPSPDIHVRIETGVGVVRAFSNMYTQDVSLITLR